MTRRKLYLLVIWPDAPSFQLSPAYFGALLDVSCGICQDLNVKHNDLDRPMLRNYATALLDCGKLHS